ncbi:ataxin-10 isoform X1 [Agrilus planipennis]|uniref:Ataxin-10 n=2 Tax=Agrilus planipennis TaxID=224129 RepID=A0A1W4WRU8_AGRPL|nr:ataxin-10 isoform X1 [Agrilus planipennis]
MEGIEWRSLDDENLKIIQEELRRKFEIVIDIYGNRSELNVGKEELDYLFFLLTDIKDRLKLDIKSEIVDLVKEIFKSLRNCMVADNDRQNYFVNKENSLLNVKEIMLILINDRECKKWTSCVKIIFQFLINLVVGNENSSEKVWSMLSDIFPDLCKKCDSYYTCALLYNIMIKCPKILLNIGTYEIILNYFEHGKENEYVLFLIELFLKHDHIHDKYASFKLQHRIILLETIKQKLVLKKDESFNISREQLLSFATEFKKKSDCILKTTPEYLSSIDVREVILLLEILASLSSYEGQLQYIQNDKSLLINCMYLLISVHQAGKQGHQEFTPIQKISQLITNTEEFEASTPAIGFKVDLIRMISNMCWKHKENQDFVREMDGIAVILDCCNIDAKNPFIIQWVIFAIHNLCENNLENQKIIASLNKQGVVDSEVLQEVGVMLHNDGESTLHIAPLEELQKRAK